MLVWTVSDFVAKKTKSLLSSLFVASIIFLIGFLTGIFPEDLLASSSLLALAGVVGFIIVHLGTMISLDDFKKQWKTLPHRYRDRARHRHRALGRRPDLRRRHQRQRGRRPRARRSTSSSPASAR